MTALPDVTTLERELHRLETEERDLDQRRAFVKGRILSTRAALTRARDEAREREREPQDRAALERTVATLRARLAAPGEYPHDKRGPTRARVARELEALEGNTTMTVHARLEAARRLARDFADRARIDGDRPGWS